MRVLGFSKKWAKLKQPVFTTFRYPRKDAPKGRDWHVGEQVQIVFRPRHEHEKLGIAVIVSKEPRLVGTITDEEAIADGFQDTSEMMDFLNPLRFDTIVNKLTIEWRLGLFVPDIQEAK